MKYQLIEIHIHTASNSRGNYSWMEASLNRDDDVFANPWPLPRYYVLNEAVVNAYKTHGLVDNELTNRYNRKGANGETLPVLTVDITKLPENLTHVSGIEQVTVPLDGIWGQIYTYDGILTNGKQVKAGDFRLGANGEVTPVRQLVLYIKKTRDNETGKEFFVEEPSVVARRVLERRYKRLDQYQVPSAPQPIGAPGPAPLTAPQQPGATPQLTPKQQAAANEAAQVTY